MAPRSLNLNPTLVLNPAPGLAFDWLGRRRIRIKIRIKSKSKIKIRSESFGDGVAS